MKRGASNMEVKRINRNRVFRYINETDKTSMPDIASALGMSGPTVLQIVKELMKLSLVKEVGMFQSTGGRKAKAIAVEQEYCYSLGVDITRNHLSFVLIDLAENIQKYVRIRKPFVFEETYFSEIRELLTGFVEDCQIPGGKIIGVGISVPGIVDQIQNKITKAHTLNLLDVDGSIFSKYIPYPYTILNDANAAVMAECSKEEKPGNLVYLSLSNTVGGAFVFKQKGMNGMGYQNGLFEKIYTGDNWRSGEFGHMVIHPGGEKCYCGKEGCLDAYCSALRLADLTDGDLGVFFKEMENGNDKYRAIWETYLDDLAIAVDNLRMCFDCDVVLGGYVGSYMEPYLDRLQEKIAKKNIFGYTGDYLKVCKYRTEMSALGAAVYQIEKYINTI